MGGCCVWGTVSLGALVTRGEQYAGLVFLWLVVGVGVGLVLFGLPARSLAAAGGACPAGDCWPGGVAVDVSRSPYVRPSGYATGTDGTNERLEKVIEQLDDVIGNARAIGTVVAGMATPVTAGAADAAVVAGFAGQLVTVTTAVSGVQGVVSASLGLVSATVGVAETGVYTATRVLWGLVLFSLLAAAVGVAALVVQWRS